MILMNDFTAEPASLRDGMLAAVRRVLQSGWYVLGPELKSFESSWANVCGTAHGVGVGNGMDAIEIAIRSLDIGPGDEVITTPMTAFATVLAIMRSGATPVLADIDPDTVLLSLSSVERCLSSKTRAVLLVHLYGQIRDLGNWKTFCDAHHLELIEDCAQAHLASWQECVAGSLGAAGAYSFYPTKNLGAPGDAGMLVTNNEQLAARASRLRNYGQSVRYEHPEVGLNSRLDEIQAAMLNERLHWLESFTERRRIIARRYMAEINNPFIQHLAPPQEPKAHVYHLFVVRCNEREALGEHLRLSGVQSLIHYPIPIHRQVPCRSIARDPKGLVITEQHAETCLSIPCHPQLSDEDIGKVIDAVNRFKVT